MYVQVGIFTQAELCQVTGLNSVTVDTWLIQGNPAHYESGWPNPTRATPVFGAGHLRGKGDR